MFRLPENQDDHIDQFLLSRVCTMPNGAYIRRSGGRAKNGLPPKYFVHVDETHHFVIRAWTDQEAVDLANQKLTKN